MLLGWRSSLHGSALRSPSARSSSIPANGGADGPDPIEGRSYGSTTARPGDRGTPRRRSVVFSFAHGDMIYELGPMPFDWTGFESAFGAKDNSARRSFVAASATPNHRIERARPTEARSHFLRRRPRRPDARRRRGEGCVARGTVASREDQRLFLGSFPASTPEPSRQSPNISWSRPPIISVHGGHLVIISSVSIRGRHYVAGQSASLIAPSRPSG